MTLTALLSAGVAFAYVGLGTVRFTVATEAVLRFAYYLRIPHEVPSWFPDWVRVHFATAFRWSARIFFLGCAYTHFEITAHALIGDLPSDYTSFSHQSIMFLQGLGAWIFVWVLTVLADELRKV